MVMPREEKARKMITQGQQINPLKEWQSINIWKRH
jgi:hypothetical protein